MRYEALIILNTMQQQRGSVFLSSLWTFREFSLSKNNIPPCLHHLLSKENNTSAPPKNVFYKCNKKKYFCWKVIADDVYYLKNPFCCFVPFNVGFSSVFVLISILEEIILMEARPNVAEMAFPKAGIWLLRHPLNGRIMK